MEEMWRVGGLILGILFLGSIAWGSSLPIDSLMAYWSFDGKNPTSPDRGSLSVNNVYNGELLSQVDDAKRGKALEFGKSGSKYPYFVTDSLRWPTNSFTIAGWLKPYSLNTDGQGWVGFVTKANGNNQGSFNLEFKDGKGSVRFANKVDWHWTRNQMIEENEYHFVTATYNGTVLKFYKDGTLIDWVDVSADIQNENSPIYVGIDFYGTHNYFYGIMDEVSLWKVALTDDQVQTLYNYNGAPVPLPASAWLLGGALAGGFLLRRRSKFLK